MITDKRWFKDLRYKLFYGCLIRRGYNLVSFGSPRYECNWLIFPQNLNAKSVIYSGGVGRDITFEHELVGQFGCNVLLFDPSPTGLETMAKTENQILQFKFQPLALAGSCGTLKFTPPQNPEEGSWFTQSDETGTLEVPSKNLSTLMRENGHDHIDFLKIDIEGAEYEVLEDLLRHRLPVKQIAVEFHHGMLPGIRRSQTVRMIIRLVAAGYKLLAQVGNNHTFIRNN
jgi:FkbM family methyltransferase